MFEPQNIMEDGGCGFRPDIIHCQSPGYANSSQYPRLLAQNSYGFEGIASSPLPEEFNYEENLQSKELANKQAIIEGIEIQLNELKEKYVDMKLEYGGLLKINEQKDVEYDGLLKINEQKDVEIAKLRKNLSVSNSKLSEYVELKTYIPYPEVCCNDVNTSNETTEQTTSPTVCQSQEGVVYSQCNDQPQTNSDSHNHSYTERKLRTAEEKIMKLEEEIKGYRRQVKELRVNYNQQEEAKARIETILKTNENDEDFDTENMEPTNSDGKATTERDTGCPKNAGNPQYNKQISLDSHTFNISCQDFSYQCHSTFSYEKGCRDPNSS